MKKRLLPILSFTLFFSFNSKAQGFTFDNAVIAENVDLVTPYGYINERYNFVEGQRVYAWIRLTDITSECEITFDWYDPSNNLVSSSTLPNFGPYPTPNWVVWHNWYAPPCTNGQWKIIYKIKNIATGQVTNVATKTFTLTCNCIPPSEPTTSDKSICHGNSANLTASGCSGGTITWWNSASGGTKVGTGSNLLTPVLTNNTTYYAQCEVGTCVSASRTAATVSISLPSVPSANGTNICNGTTASLTASGCSGGTITWWNSASGGTKVGTGSTFLTPVLTNNTTYYAQCEIGTCVSASRTALAVTVQQCSTPVISNLTGIVLVTPNLTTCTTDPLSINVRFQTNVLVSAQAGQYRLQGNTIILPITVGSCNNCLQLVTDQSLNFNIGTLAAGNYTIQFENTSFANESSFTSQKTFTVQQCNTSPAQCPTITLENYTFDPQPNCKYNVRFTLSGAPRQLVDNGNNIFFRGYEPNAFLGSTGGLRYTVKDCVDSSIISRFCPTVVDDNPYCACNGIAAGYCSPNFTGYANLHVGECTGNEKIEFTILDVSPNAELLITSPIKYYSIPISFPTPSYALAKTCDLTYRVTVPNLTTLTANPVPTRSKCGSGAQVFILTDNNLAILNGQNGTVNWYTDANATQAISNASAYPTLGGTVYARIVSPQGCKSNIISVGVQVTTQSANSGSVGSTSVYCSGSNDPPLGLSTLLTGVVGDTRIWQSITPLGSNFNAATGTLTLTGLAVNTYQFKYVVSNGCGRDSTIVTVRIASKPTVNTIDTVRKCGNNLFDLTQSDAAILGNQSGSRVTWFRDANGTNAVLTPTAFDIAISSTVYAQVINPDNCKSPFVAVRLKLIPTPNTGSARPQYKFCYRASGLTAIRLDSLIDNEQTGGVWSFTPDSQNPNAAFNVANGTLNPNGLSAGLYRFNSMFQYF